MTLISLDVILTLNSPYRAQGEGELSCVTCCCVETINRRVMLYASKDREKNICSDDITFITLSKSSDLL